MLGIRTRRPGANETRTDTEAGVDAVRPQLRGVRVWRPWLEDALVIVAAALATLHAEWRIISKPLTFQTDAFIHEFWMRRFQDPALFGDPLTGALLQTGYSPPAFRSVHWLASHVVDPVFFGELLPLVLQPLAVWLLFRIIRHHTAWWPAAWIGAALFLVPWDIHRFSGGHPRAFAQPIVLLVVLLLLSRRPLAAVLVPAVGVLLYPPAGLVALLIVFLAALEPQRRFGLNANRLRWAGASALGVGAALVLTRLTTGSGEVITASEARGFAEFGPDGQMHFFGTSTLDYLRQNYSGFFLQDSGSLLAVAALLLLAVRPRNARLIRWEVWCVPIAALLLFAAAHALLFRLYLPHRYTYPLLPFFCIAVAVSLRPTLQAVAERARPSLVAAPPLALGFAFAALSWFPLGPQMSSAEFGSWLTDAAPYLALGLGVGLLFAVLWVRTAPGTGTRASVAAGAAAIVAATLFVAEVTVADGARSPGATVCRDRNLYGQLGTLPKDAIVAADPFESDCLPIAARRPVVISRKLYQPWAVDYFEVIRERMFQTIRAFYGPSVGDIVQLRERYGADYFLVRTRGDERAWSGLEPFSSEVHRLRSSVSVPAPEKLPDGCLTWRNRSFELYSLDCVAREEAR